MNSLSWLIYLMQVSDGLRDTTAFVGALSTIVLLIWGIIGVICSIDAPAGSEQFILIQVWWKAMYRYGFWVLLLCFVLFAFLPSRQTMLLIAGSEISQRVVASEGVKSIMDPSMDLLKTWIAEEKDRILNKKKEK
jgi:hypothetical protein